MSVSFNKREGEREREREKEGKFALSHRTHFGGGRECNREKEKEENACNKTYLTVSATACGVSPTQSISLASNKAYPDALS